MKDSPQQNRLARQYTGRTLLGFALPSILMSIFLSFYTVVDGIFIARYAGTLALSAINMFFPVLSIEFGIAVMLAAGGSAMIARNMGEGRFHVARARFTALIALMAAASLLLGSLGWLYTEEIMQLLGASCKQMPDATAYARIHFLFLPCLFLQFAAQTFFVTAGRPGMGLLVTLLAGITNILLDYAFIALLGWGVSGAALATGIGCAFPALCGVTYFSKTRTASGLFFSKPRLPLHTLGHICGNGSSEMVTHLANFTTGYLFNRAFMAHLGENGVAAFTIALYFEFLFTAVFYGYSSGVAPIISYKYGGHDLPQLKLVTRKNLTFILLLSAAAFLFSNLTLPYTLPIFIPENSEVYAIVQKGFPLYSFAFLLGGIGMYTPAHFTALSNGRVSAIISLGRTFIFLVGSILILPLFLGTDGLWLAMPAAELLGVWISAMYLLHLRHRYGY